MAHLTVQQAREISLAAARAILGEPVDVEVVAGADHTDDDAWFITYRFDDAAQRAKAAAHKWRISRTIRDELVDRGDESYPYIRFASAANSNQQSDLESA